MLHPPKFRANATSMAHPLIYVTHLASAKEYWSLNVTINSTTKSYTSLNKPPLSSAVCAKTLIYQGHRISERDIRQESQKLETRGDIMIRGLWDRQNSTVTGIKLWDSNTDTYRFDPMAALLDWWDKNNKNNHGKNCHGLQNIFLHLFYLSIAC